MERVAVFGDAGTGKSTLVMRLRGWLETVDQAQLQVWARFVFGDRRPKMKHATAEDLIPIAGLLDKIRRESVSRSGSLVSSTGVERLFCTSTRILAAFLLTFAVLTTGNALPSTIEADRLCC